MAPKGSAIITENAREENVSSSVGPILSEMSAHTEWPVR